ncbi:gamma-interferon-inducible-lysosomal thiol reductase [Eurytemora carolleeae]|uniref:gamma-interferon-inducible-lysosomal thiol reductase n=1 Tax=Eurytemora carolleeae TaxID=1294199 RepID=UPI000C756403|nr:gamma-interferon-inducible-lysosomal thiol reductase [Eurytemora carolleeae]|eukprot:XP_023342039.1 gamma-interferon-inducible-lysosomal thiol reductase-like [Eurytemora affinis]
MKPVLLTLLTLSVVCSTQAGFIGRIFEIFVEPEPVTVELYYESLCPGCRYFVETQLFPTFYKLKDAGIVQFSMYPYGNAKESQNPDGTWKFECQHGDKECTGNLIEV